MKNTFKITDPENKMMVSLEYEDTVEKSDKEKLHKIMLIALELWEGTEKVYEELQKINQTHTTNEKD